ncbi:MAG: hypothetical protein FWC47_01745 [Oscillospiraceae bacterium]|nr:hypothetical protein [Oscillospiraceae bacterium]
MKNRKFIEVFKYILLGFFSGIVLMVCMGFVFEAILNFHANHNFSIGNMLNIFAFFFSYLPIILIILYIIICLFKGEKIFNMTHLSFSISFCLTYYLLVIIITKIFSDGFSPSHWRI